MLFTRRDLTKLINIYGNALLNMGFHMGAAGAAIATLFARIVGAAIMVRLVCCKETPIYVEKILHYKPDWAVIGRILAIGVPNGFEGSVFQLGKVMTQSIISTFGAVSIAANAAANTFASLMYVPGNAIGQAQTTVVGRCVGAVGRMVTDAGIFCDK